jgi:RimJ/RimL family protein N-acetyltransferase
MAPSYVLVLFYYVQDPTNESNRAISPKRAAMTQDQNAFGQPVGPSLNAWTERPFPPATPMLGRYCSLEPLNAERHATDLFAAYAEAPDGRDWTYLFVGPFVSLFEYVGYLRNEAAKRDPQHHAIIDAATGKPVGTAALMRIDPANGVIEVGHVTYTPRLKRSRAGTEAMFLLMKRVFDELKYRRYEWKCDSLNAPSRRAAERYGFAYEGTFRQAIVYKGRNRDTAWYAMTDRDWPLVRAALEQWLSPENFDPNGRQRRTLSQIRLELSDEIRS